MKKEELRKRELKKLRKKATIRVIPWEEACADDWVAKQKESAAAAKRVATQLSDTVNNMSWLLFMLAEEFPNANTSGELRRMAEVLKTCQHKLRGPKVYHAAELIEKFGKK